MAATLRVVSWNIRAAIGPGPFPDRWWRRIDADRLRAIGSFLSGLEPDIVALQEVAVVSRDGELIDNASYLAGRLDLPMRFAAARTFEVREDGELRGVGLFGNAMLSRLPISSTRCVALPRAPADALIEPLGATDPRTGERHPLAGVRYPDAPPDVREPRCLLLAELDGLRVGSTHFSHIGSGERRLQADATVAAFDGAPASLLLGDLNAAVNAPELESLASWTDAFAEPAGDPTRVSTEDGWQIDQVLGRGLAVRGARVLREAGELSDHYPVAAEVTVPQAP